MPDRDLPTNFKKGQNFRAGDANIIADVVNAVRHAKGINGILVNRTRTGITITDTKFLNSTRREGSAIVTIYNDSDEDFEGWIPVGITGQFFSDEATSHKRRERVLTARRAVGEDALLWAVTSEPIKRRHTGEAIMSGIARINMRRWWPTPFHRVDIFEDTIFSAGPTVFDFILPNPAGCAELLWEETDSEGKLIIQEQHDAIIRIGGPPVARYRWKNRTGGTISHGEILSFNATLTTDNAVELKTPTEDDDQLVYINIGGDVKHDEFGSAIFSEGLFLARVNEEVEAGDDVGTASMSNTFKKDNTGFQVAQYMGGDPTGAKFALIFRVGGGGNFNWTDYES